MKVIRFVYVCVALSCSSAIGQTNPVPPDNKTLSENNIVLAGRAQPDLKTRRTVAESYGKLPLSFEANQGQTDSEVKFLTHDSGYTLFLTSDEAVFSPSGYNRKAGAVPATNYFPRIDSRMQKPAVLRMKLVGASAATVTGETCLPGKINYFIGNDPKKWRTNVPTYAKVKYQSIYPGIDLIYYGNQRRLEYDFVVAPGADPRRIQFDIRGAKNIRRDEHGDLVLRLGQGAVRWNKPIVYQEKNGTRLMVHCRYVIQRGRRIGFEVASYDLRRPLIIDPAVAYSTYLGGSVVSVANGIAIDSLGNAYVTGYTDSTDFPTTSNAFQTTCKAGCTSDEAFVTEFNASGSALVYSTYIGGSSGDVAHAIAVDSSGDAYLTGNTSSADFPTTSGAFQTTCASTCAFVTELNPTGSSPLYSTYLGGSEGNGGTGVTINGLGNAYVTGYTTSANFPTTPGAFQTACKAGCTYGEGFVTEFNASGSALVYSTFLGGSGDGRSNGDAAFAIAVDGFGDAYVTGQTFSSDFPTTPGAFQTTLNGSVDAFVTEFNPGGTALVYSTYLGGSGGDGGTGIAVNATGNAYVTGGTSSIDFPTTPGVLQTHCAFTNCDDGEGFVTEFNASGSALVYSTYLGGSGSPDFTGDHASAIVVDDSGNAYVTGQTASDDFPITQGAFETGCSSGPIPCAFVTELNPGGSALAYSTYLGGGSRNLGGGAGSNAIAVDSSDNYYVTGTAGLGFPTTPGAFQPNLSGQNSDAFVIKFVPGDQVWPLLLSFGSQIAGVTTQPQTTTLTNSDSNALTITSIGITGANSSDFGETNNCGTSLTPGSSCNISVTFDPTVIGARSATVSISDNAANSPQTVALSGTGTSPVTLTPSNLAFGGQAVGIPSAPEISTVTNIGNVSLTITAIVITGANGSEFAQTNNCPSSVAPNRSCQISVTFTPTAPGTAIASIMVTDTATGSPQALSLTGMGDGPLVSLSPPLVTFPDQYVGTSGLPQTVTLMNNGNAALTITSVTASPSDFAPLSACGNSVAAGASCSIGVFFDPTTSGTRNGALTVTDSTSDSPQTATLTGIGQDFSLAPSGSSSVTVTPGQTAKYKITVAPAGGFNQAVTLTCSGAPVGSTCSLSSSSVTLNGSSSTSVTVTVSTAGTSAGLVHPAESRRGSLYVLLSIPGLFGLVLLPALRRKDPRSARFWLLAIGCILSAAVMWSGCGGGSSTGNGGTLTGSYNVTVTGTSTSGSNTLTHNANLTLVVQ